MKETTKKIIAYFEENEELFDECIEELDSYNGYLGDDRYYEMEMLDEFYSGQNPTEILTRAYYGHDDETFTIDSDGTKNYSMSTFNPNRNYFYFNGYGNLVSSDYKDYSCFLNEETIDSMSDNRTRLDSIDSDLDLAILFDELEKEETELMNA